MARAIYLIFPSDVNPKHKDYKNTISSLHQDPRAFVSATCRLLQRQSCMIDIISN